MLIRTLLLLFAAISGFAVETPVLGSGPSPASATIFPGGTIPTSGQVVYSDGTALAGDAGLKYTAASDLLVVNHNAASAPASPQADTVLLQLVGLDTTTTRVLIDGFGGAPSFCGRRAQGTNGGQTGVISGSQLVQLQGLGYTSAGAYTTTATVSVVLSAAETWSGTNQGTQVIIQTTPIGGSVTQAPVATFKSAGITFAAGAPLTISDTTASTTTAGALLIGTGTAATTVTFGGGAGNIGSTLTTGGNISCGATVFSTAGRFTNTSTGVSTAAGTGGVAMWRSGGTIGTAGDMVFQSDLGVTNAAFVFRAGPTTPITVATLSGAAVAGTTPAFATVGLSTITGGVTDGYNASVRLTPTYDAATALTVTRHDYIDLNQPAVTGVGPAAVTDAAVFRFDAAIGTHKALAANASVAVTLTSVGPTGAATTVQGWLKINCNGTLRYIPFWEQEVFSPTWCDDMHLAISGHPRSVSLAEYEAECEYAMEYR